MAQETLDLSHREIKFGGEGKAESIKRGFAITTLRNPRDAYNFSPGEVIFAYCFDDGEKVPVVIIANEVKKLKDFAIPQLALDGFFSAEQAAEEMKAWPGYEKTRISTKMQAITFVTKEAYDKIPGFYKRNFEGREFHNLIHRKELRHLFFPTMCFHFCEKMGDLGDWGDFLYLTAGIITSEESDSLVSYKVQGKDMFQVIKRNTNILQKIALDPKNSLFKPFVLALFEEE
jgi:hypothetical protein